MPSGKYNALMIVLTGSLLGVQWGLFNFVFHLEMHPIYFFFYGYFLSLGIAMHAFMMKAMQKQPQKFVAAFMGGLSIKMLISLIVLMISIFQLREMSLPLALTFLVLYFTFSGIEVYSLFTASKNQKEK